MMDVEEFGDWPEVELTPEQRERFEAAAARGLRANRRRATLRRILRAVSLR